MNTPLFLEIESSSPDEGAFPIAVSWSLPDGQLKTVIVMPDDDWNPHENVHYSKDLDLCFDQGVTPADILREMEEDLSGHSVFSSQLDETAAMLEVLFESIDSDPSFELHELTSIDRKLADAYDLLSEIYRQYDLDPENVEQRILGNLYLAREAGLL